MYDDTAFFLVSKDINYLNTELTIAANIFKYWCHLNRLTRNLKKVKLSYLVDRR